MKNILILLFILSYAILLSSCSPWQDNFPGTNVSYYLQNNTSKNLYYELEGAFQNIEPTGIVEMDTIKQIGWTKQIEVSGHPFSTIKVYDNVERNVILFETSSSPNIPTNWLVEKIDQQERIYKQTLALDDEKLILQ